MSPGDGKHYLSVCCPSADDRPRQTSLRALEGIENRLQLLSGPSGTAGHAESKGDRITVCVLADDLRDSIVEYRRSPSILKPQICKSSWMDHKQTIENNPRLQNQLVLCVVG